MQNLSLTEILLYAILVWNIIVFIIYGFDKAKAKLEGFRVPESFLISTAFILGGVGAIIGMVAFHHKISKPKFRWLIPFALLITIACFGYLVYTL